MVYSNVQMIYDKYLLHSDYREKYTHIEENILQLFNNGVVDHNNDCMFIWIGLYYFDVDKKPDLMEFYYMAAIDKGDAFAMFRAACHYLKKRHIEYVKYFQMSFDNGYHFSAIYASGMCYFKKKYNLAKICCNLAIDGGSSVAMTNMGYYYYHIENNKDLMMHYYLMAIERKHTLAMIHLGDYYKNIEKNNTLMVKYYEMAVEHKDYRRIYDLAYYYEKLENGSHISKIYYTISLYEDILIKIIGNKNDTYVNGHYHVYDMFEKNTYFEIYANLLYEIGNFHKHFENDDLAFHMYNCAAIQGKGYDKALKELIKYDKILQYYNYLTKLPNDDRYAKRKIDELENNSNVIIYNHKLKKSKTLNNYGDCTECTKTNVLLLYPDNCSDGHCNECYIKYCPFDDI
jgi:hypothetical protein